MVPLKLQLLPRATYRHDPTGIVTIMYHTRINNNKNTLDHCYVKQHQQCLAFSLPQML
jgi:hypothetical protein